MEGSGKLYELLKDLVEQLPSLLTLLACMGFAVARWKRHPRVSLMVLIALGWLAVHGIVYSVVYNWVPDKFIPSATEANREIAIRNVYLVLGLSSSGSVAVALAILLAAIFRQRDLPKKSVNGY